jgi:hypothetical protein
VANETRAQRRALTLALVTIITVGGAAVQLAMPEREPKDALERLAARHRGPGPCLRWTHREPTEDELAAASAATLDAGFTAREAFEAGVYLEHTEGIEREARAHERSLADEIVSALPSKSLLAPLIREVSLRPKAKQTQALFEASARSLSAQTAPAWNAFTPDEQQRLEQLWTAYPFTVVSSALGRRMQRDVTLERMRQLEPLLRADAAKKGRWALDPGELGLDAASTQDAWGEPLHFRAAGDDYELVASGEDRKYGTWDDLTLTVRSNVP